MLPEIAVFVEYLLQRVISDSHTVFLEVAERMLLVGGFALVQINAVGVAAVGKKRN